ncbi:MAG: hypothetical protein Faunusvirus57_6 [Faunusvirus sp.]|jgi:hypothetical protein|uniref:Uncharacterized protein n=1 Tax=Faunusvirus sp. TaxID=2487766 RepID=A0A3G4ZY26_9VIRU|nr:MAG: hypothetical protein Faunusvirus57_6 [Faunusvirus sp.]
MQTAGAIRDGFIKLLQNFNEDRCLKYIDKYDGFYNMIVDNGSSRNMLEMACAYKLDRVAIALIDKKCDLTYQDRYGVSAIMFASCYGLKNVVTHIINNSQDTKTRTLHNGVSEMMML